MNKYLALALLFVSFSANAQLKVGSNGHVGIGTQDISSLLSIGEGKPSYTASFAFNNDNNGLFIKNRKTGITVQNHYSNGEECTGICVMPTSGSTNQTAIGIKALTGMSNSTNFGLCGVIPPIANGSIRQSAIFGSSSYAAEMQYAGTYAGYFHGDVRVVGALYANVLTPTASSSTGLSNVMLYSQEKPVSDLLSTVEMVEIRNENVEHSFNRKSDFQSEKTQDFLNGYQEFPLLSIEEQEKQNNTKMSSVKYGLAAEQLKDVYPELVYEDAEGNVSINYVEMVPLLVQSINELNARIKVLEEKNGVSTEKEVENTKMRFAESASIASDCNAEILCLYQNTPNPFTQSTSIKITIPSDVRNVCVQIFDMAGKRIKKIDVVERGQVAITVSSEGLTTGMYLYALIADGKVIDSKKMILN